MSVLWNVGGDWDFCADSENQGIQKGWFRNKPIESKPVTIPHIWTSEKKTSKESIAFYFKSFEVNKAESSKRFFIQFDSVHHFAQVWLNGELAGTHLGGHIPFRIDGSKFVKVGESNFLAVRVEAPGETGQLIDRPSSEIPLGAVYKRSPFAGISGNMHFLMGGRAGIRSVNCYPDYEADRVTIETRFWNPKNYKSELEFTITAPDGTTGTLPKLKKLEKENDTYSITFNIDKAKTWDLDEPNLYTVRVNLRGSYAMETRFGLRRAEIERCMLKVNHQIIKIKGVQYLQAFPYTGPMAPEGFDLKADLQRVKDAGFNLIRSGGVPFTNEILDICDEIGLLAIQESTCYNQKSNKDGLEELKELLEEMMISTGSHPSLVLWGVGSENGSMALENGNKLLRYCSEIDPYRPIVSNFNSVSLESSGGGKIDLGKVYNPTETKIESFESHHFTLMAPVPVASRQMLIQYGSSKDAKAISDGVHGGKSFWERYNYMKDELGGKILVSGLGMGVPSDLDSLLADPGSKPYQHSEEYKEMADLSKNLAALIKEVPCFKDTQAFFKEAELLCQKALGTHIESLTINSQISGYVFETWADIRQDYSGLVTKTRQPKPVLDYLKACNEKIKIMSEAEVRTPYLGTSAAIKIFILNDDYLKEYGLLVRVKGPNGRIWHQESMPGKAKAGLNSMGRFKFPVGTEPGEFTFDLSLTEGKKEIARKEESFLVPPKTDLDGILKKVSLKGDFPNTITYAQNSEAHLTIATDLKKMARSELAGLMARVKEGHNLVLGCLNFEDAEALNQSNLLPFKIELSRFAGAAVGQFQYALKNKLFNKLPAGGLMDEPYADVLAQHTLEIIPGAEIFSGAVHLGIGSGHLKNPGRTLSCASIDVGQGKLVIYQLDIFSQLGSNALADALFGNLVAQFSK